MFKLLFLLLGWLVLRPSSSLAGQNHYFPPLHCLYDLFNDRYKMLTSINKFNSKKYRYDK